MDHWILWPVFVLLNGAAAALRYIDARQKRAGTTTALIARGAARVTQCSQAATAIGSATNALP